MEYKLLSFSNMSAAAFLPKPLIRRCMKGTAFCFGAIEQKLAGCVVYSFSASDKTELRLEYCYVLEDCRGRGIAAALMDFAEEQLKTGGGRAVNCRLCGTDDEEPMFSLFLEKKNYRLLQSDRRMFLYSKEAFAESLYLSRLNKANNRLLRKAELSPIQWNRFVREAEELGIILTGCRYNDACSHFFHSGENLIGCLLAEQEGREIYLKALCLIQDKQASTYTLLYLLKAFGEDVAGLPEGTRIHLLSEDERYDRLYELAFGTPLETERIYDYYKKI